MLRTLIVLISFFLGLSCPIGVLAVQSGKTIIMMITKSIMKNIMEMMTMTDACSLSEVVVQKRYLFLALVDINESNGWRHLWRNG